MSGSTAVRQCRVAGAAGLAWAVAFAVVLLLGPDRAAAQTPACVVQQAPMPPPRHIVRCRDGLTLEAEASARYGLRGRSAAGPVDGVVLQSGAVLVDVPAAAASRGFRVLTPQAVAAVRGTRWAVDASPGSTAVFVVEGLVLVRRPRGRGAAVALGPGEGVDVGPGAAPLVVRRWPRERAAALLARFGR